MRFSDWEPHYTAILDYFGFEREADEAAARTLADLAGRDDVGLLEAFIRGRQVTVCGNAPPAFPGELDRIEGDGACRRCGGGGARGSRYPAGRGLHRPRRGRRTFSSSSRSRGTVMVVHAHGDNVPLLRHWVPRIPPGPLVATTQAAPLPPHVHNFGGFTDGDRAVFAADELGGAASVRIVGFDLADKNVDPPLKRGKLYWAGELLRLIGYDLQ
ncbi:hypothetical protein [Methanoculleus chikugoensis]|uniref:hypothetical protein n=1 Tax=Methanoculleus chikugoensis TaxID=118126 RepID=UPI000B217D77|nr:hypothetical protein [Methanoculleus chikugoensis]